MTDAPRGATSANPQRVKARSISRLAYATAAVNIVWYVADPEPTAAGPVIAVLAILPWCALWLMARSHGMFHLSDKGIYRGAGVLFIVPCALLAVRTLSSVHLVTWWQCLPYTFFGGAVLAFIVSKVDKRALRGKKHIGGTLVITCCYIYGLILQANTLLDWSPPQSFTVLVFGKHISGGVRSPISRHLIVGAWGPHEDRDEITVPAMTFGSVRVGGQVCVLVRPGAFGLPWYAAEPC